MIVSVFPEFETQYEITPLSSPSVIASLAVVYVPVVEESPDRYPRPPDCWTVAVHAHPPVVASVVQLPVAYPRL